MSKHSVRGPGAIVSPNTVLPEAKSPVSPTTSILLLLGQRGGGGVGGLEFALTTGPATVAIAVTNDLLWSCGSQSQFRCGESGEPSKKTQPAAASASIPSAR